MVTISGAASRAAALTRQLLTFSRRRASEFKLISINDIVRDTERMVRRLIGEDIEIILSLSAESGYLRADGRGAGSQNSGHCARDCLRSICDADLANGSDCIQLESAFGLTTQFLDGIPVVPLCLPLHLGERDSL
jgi:hypothetical protein